MVFSSSICCLFLSIFIVVSFIYPINSFKTQNHESINETFRSKQELQKLKKTIATRLQKINKPAVKTIQVSNGDIIDCVLIHKQLAFDHPLLKGQKPMHFPVNLTEQNQIGNLSDFQLLGLSGESCPEGTIPVRRVTEQDMLRAHSIDSFGRKVSNQLFPHEYAIVILKDDEFFGAQATFNVWHSYVERKYEFSLSQMWLASGRNGRDLNTIEAGWHVYPRLYGDDRPRFFVLWTADAYRTTGCYNLDCPGYVHTNPKFPIGGEISNYSTYKGKQFTITLKILKDKNTGNWLLQYEGNTVGYWPATLFTHLKYHAEEVHFGGEIVNAKTTGSHTFTVMGSGHFAEEGFGKATYIRDLRIIDSDNNLTPLKNPIYHASNSNCYNIIGKTSPDPQWGSYIFFGGPGRSEKCP